MKARYLFEFPVYMLREHEYHKQCEKWVERNLFRGPGEFTEDDIEKERAHLRSVYGGPWRYNAIVGYLRVFFCGSQVRGELYKGWNKRPRRKGRRYFYLFPGDVCMPVDIKIDETSEAIYSAVSRCISECKSALRPRHIDSALFDALGPHINWKSLYVAAEK